MATSQEQQQKNSSALFQKIDLLSPREKEDISTTTKKNRMATTITINPEFCESISTYFKTPVPNSSNYIPHDFRIPITKLEGIEVLVELYKYCYDKKTPEKFGIKINCPGICDNDDVDDRTSRRLFTKTDFKSIMEALTYFVNEFLPKFKIDNLNGELVVEDIKKDKTLLLEFCGLLQGFDRVETKYNKCVVCYDLTKTKTGCCECALCLTCVSKLEFITSDQEGYGYKCPHCREITDILSNNN